MTPIEIGVEGGGGAGLPFSPREVGLSRVLGRSFQSSAVGLLLLFRIKMLWFWLAGGDESAVINRIPEVLM